MQPTTVTEKCKTQSLSKSPLWPLLIVLLAALILPARHGNAATVVTIQQTEEDRQLTLELQKYLFWQQLNQARRNPMAIIERLNLPLVEVQRVLGQDAWILDQGLPPLAWDNQLSEAASLHGRDMINNLYYSHTSLDGRQPCDRVAATGYDAVQGDETLGLLVFDHYIEYARAIAALVDNILRDELLGTLGVSRNIFSPDFQEVGISFFAETLPRLTGQPYVYLLVIEFAEPQQPTPFVIGAVDNTGARLAMQRTIGGFWDFLPLLPGGGFQVALPDGGARFVALDQANHVIAEEIVSDDGEINNHYLDLRHP